MGGCCCFRMLHLAGFETQAVCPIRSFFLFWGRFVDTYDCKSMDSHGFPTAMSGWVRDRKLGFVISPIYATFLQPTFKKGVN